MALLMEPDYKSLGKSINSRQYSRNNMLEQTDYTNSQTNIKHAASISDQAKGTDNKPGKQYHLRSGSMMELTKLSDSIIP